MKNLLFTSFLLLLSLKTNAQIQEADSLALVDIFYSLNGEEWNDPWDLSMPVETWEDVFLEGDRVDGLRFSYSNISGTIPEAILDLDMLTYINFRGTDITDFGEAFLAQLPLLEYFYIENHKLAFSIDPIIGNSNSLRIISFRDNEITGGIPQEICLIPSLEELDLTDNQLSGEVPQSFSNSLNHIDLADNFLTGDISNIFQNNTELTTIDLSENQLSGSFSPDLINNEYLIFIDFSQNDLSGPLPENLGELENLRQFMLDENNFSGTFPESINSCHLMINFIITDNDFSGVLPTSLEFYENLETFDIGNNNFSGEIPANLCEMGRANALGNYLNIANNNLTGDLPACLNQIPKLKILDLSNNDLNVSIDLSFLNAFTSCLIMGLEGLNLEGDFPELNLPDLQALNISNNNLTGEFPSLIGLPDLRNSAWTGFSMTGEIFWFHNYNHSVETDFCVGNDFTNYPDFVYTPDLDIEELNLSCFANEGIDADNDGYNEDVDCNDENAAINPGMEEIPNNDVDENCDGIALVIDNDNDGYNSDEDCNDVNININPGAEEIPNNTIDEDCDGIALIIDDDNDGFNSDDDCNDENAAIFPGADEIPNNDEDEDCDGITLVIDNDEDGFNSDEDCNDEDPNIFPGAEEIPNNGEDEDCNGEDLIVSNSSSIDFSIKVFPNPVVDILWIDASNRQIEFSIWDTNGKLIISKQQNKEINLSALNKGIFFIEIRDLNTDMRSVKQFLKW